MTLHSYTFHRTPNDQLWYIRESGVLVYRVFDTKAEAEAFAESRGA